jgi:uncharacterized protein with ATP-grasp and redox domains
LAVRPGTEYIDVPTGFPEAAVELDPQCIVCLFRLASRTARAATANPRLQGQIIDRLADELPKMPVGTIPPQVGRLIQRIVGEITGDADPFREARRQSNALVLARLPVLQRQVERAGDPLREAVRLAVAGNVIDLAFGPGFDIDRAIRESLELEFSVFDYDPFREALEGARRVLHIADNAGEIVFDRLLVDELLRRGLQVTVAVRGGPAINDACLEDARQAGFDPHVEIIDTGTDLPSVLLEESGPVFLSHYREADVVISKGQGNFEGLRQERGPIAFLLRAKCRPVAAWLGVDQGAQVLRYRDQRDASP